VDRIAWRSLRARPGRTILTIFGIALGVAVLFAGLATNASIETSVDRTVRDLVGQADLRVAAFGETGLSRETLDAIQGTPGVAVAAPALERETYLLAGPSVGLPGAVTIVGIDPTIEPLVHDLALADGSPLTGLDEPGALITKRLAADDGLVVGSELTIQGAGATAKYRVVGILAADGPSGGTFGRTVVVPLRTAQAVFDQEGLTRVDLALEPGTDPATIATELEARLLTEPYVLSSPADMAASLRSSTADFQATTALIAAIALFTGAFLIFNTLSMTLVERARELGLLRAAGATRGQVTGYVMRQALLLGIVGSLLGLLVGSILAAVLVADIRSVGDVTLRGPSLPASAFVAAFVVGVVVTLAAAIEPARRAGRISPIEALKARSEGTSARRARLAWLVVVFVAVAVAGLLVWPRGIGDAGVARALIVYAILLVATLLLPLILRPLTRLAGRPFELLFRLEERLARGSLNRDRSRAILTIGPLAVGLAAVVALGAVGLNARASAGDWVADVIPGDVVATSIRPIPSDEGVAATLAETAGVARVSEIATFDVAVNGRRTDGAAVTGADLAADGRLRFVSGDRDAALAALDAGGATIVPTALASRLGLTMGQVLDVAAADGTILRLTIAGIAERTLPGRGGEALLVGWGDAVGWLGVIGADAFAVRFASDAPVTARQELVSTAALAALDVVTLDQIEGAIDSELSRVFGLFDGLALVAVLVAALGIVNTLTMNVIERVREIGVLRAAGMTRGQVWRSVVVEAGIVGLAGALMGVAAGLVIGLVMVALAGGRADLNVMIPWGVIAAAYVLGVAVAMLAAAYPAHVASRISIIRAVQYE
jgi:putative ABC transport system permease protein